MDTEYGQAYRDLFQRHWWWRAREEFIMQVLRRREPPDGWRSALDIGCGDGLFFDRLRTLVPVIEGVEPDRHLVSETGPHREHIYVGPFEEFDPQRRYSLVLMLDVLEHLAEPVDALRRVVSLLEPTGVFVATLPAFNALWTQHDVMNHHHMRYTKHAFREQARAAGMAVLEARYFFHWMFPAKLLVRLKERLRPAAPAVPAVPGTPINRFLYGLSEFERRTVGRLRPPFGSSLLAIGGHAGA